MPHQRCERGEKRGNTKRKEKVSHLLMLPSRIPSSTCMSFSLSLSFSSVIFLARYSINKIASLNSNSIVKCFKCASQLILSVLSSFSFSFSLSLFTVEHSFKLVTGETKQKLTLETLKWFLFSFFDVKHCHSTRSHLQSTCLLLLSFVSWKVRTLPSFLVYIPLRSWVLYCSAS